MKTRRSAIKTLLGTTAICACPLHRFYAVEELEAEWRCNYNGEKFDDSIYTFGTNQDAKEVVENIVKHTGLSQNFEILAANVPNAMATIRGEKRYILYNQEFMEGVDKATETDWGGTSILAHEIGHHLQGHTIQAGGSRPTIELEADDYSGFVMRRMGATVLEAKAAMENIGSDSGSSTHPKKRDRLVAIVAGWTRAKELEKIKIDDVPDKPKTTPVEQSTIPEVPQQSPQAPSGSVQTTGAQPVARCVFQGDANIYLVMSDNAIISFNQGKQAIQIGRRIPPTLNGFAWMYQNSFTSFGVDGQGKIWSRNAFGQPMQVGYVTNP